MTWQEHLLQQRKYQLGQIKFLGSGKARLHVIEGGVTRDVTEERLEQTKKNLAEVEQILRDEGFSLDA